MLGAYAVTHAAIAAIMVFGKEGLSFREHLTAITYALPSLVIMWLMLRVCWPLYQKNWFKRLKSLPMIGVYFVIIPILIPIAMVSAAIVVGGDKVHESAIWQLVALVSVYVGVGYGMRSLMQRAE